MRELDERGVSVVLREALVRLAHRRRLHVSLDMDVLDPGEAPGVGTPVPGGLTYREAHLLMEIVAESGRVASAEVVEINPIHRPDVPETAPEIINRVNEISFNSSLMAEMRAIDFVQRLLDQGAVDPARYKRLFLHSINAEALMARFNVSTKFNGDARFLAELRDLGREATGAWLASSFDRIGRESSVDLRARYL